MQTKAILAVLALLTATGCATLPVRDFRADYESVSSKSVKIDGYPPFNVAELRALKRLKVQLNMLAQVFGSITDPLVLLGLSDGIPSAFAHRTAAQAYLAETGRSSCSIVDGAVSPNGREFEFHYTCSDGT